jgi:cellulose synthase/poly-beta-1,6-N-acetylglucosamine synthase-like glycosyltransferase
MLVFSPVLGMYIRSSDIRRAIKAVRQILCSIFVEPVAVLSLKEILLILAFAITFDFFWQFAFRVVVILIARAHKNIANKISTRKINKIVSLSSRINKLENKLSVAEEKDSSTTGILKKLANARKKLRELQKVTDKEIIQQPFVSIIIPCHNSEEVIEDTLKQVVNLNYENKEIIVVDDGSTDKTFEVASKFKDSINLIRREFCSGRKTGATNFGLSFAKGDIIVVIDDDTIVERNSLKPLVEPLFGQDVAAVGGNVEVFSEKNNLLTKFQSIEYLIIMQLVKPFQAYFYRAVLIISGSYGAFHKKYLERIGAWDVDIITEDLDLTWKLYRLKKRVLHSEKAVCFTEVPTSLKALAKQRNRWDFGLFETISKHRGFLFSRRFPALGFALLPETIFFEIIAIAARPLYILVLILTGRNLYGTVLLVFYFYLALEFLIIFITGLLSSDKRFCLKAVYAPLMLFYHQFLALVRIRALYRFAAKKGIEW